MTCKQDLKDIEENILSGEDTIKANVCVAQWFVMNASMSLDEALKTLRITQEQFNRYKDIAEY